MSETKKLRAAVIGCGCISCRHIDTVVALEEVELVALCDIDPKCAEYVEKQYKVPAYTDYKEMFEKEDLDAVHICLPHYLHTVVAQDALRAGLHVMSEKPMSIKYKDAVETVELAEKLGLTDAVKILLSCRIYGSVTDICN